jgi:hypothetical protein
VREEALGLASHARSFNRAGIRWPFKMSVETTVFANTAPPEG